MRRLAITTAIVVATLVCLALLWHLRGAVFLFGAALLAAAAIRPLAEWPERWGLSRIVALTVTYLAIVFVVCVLGLSVIGPLADDITGLTADVTDTYRYVTTPTVKPTTLQSILARVLPPSATSPVDVGPSVPVVAMLVGMTVAVIGALIDSVLVLVLSLYWNFDRVHFERLWLSLLSVNVRGRAREIWHEIENECGAYLRSEVLQGLAAGLLLYIGARLIGQPYPMLVAFVGAVAWLLPWIGGVVTVLAVVACWVPDAVIRGGQPLWLAAAPMAIYTAIVLSFLEYVVEPRIFDRRRYNPLLVILVTVGLADFMGMLGILLGPLLAAAIHIVCSHLFGSRAAKAAVEPARSQLPLAERLARLQQRLSEMPEPPSKLSSLVGRLSALLDDAEQSSKTKAIPLTVAGSDRAMP